MGDMNTELELELELGEQPREPRLAKLAKPPKVEMGEEEDADDANEEAPQLLPEPKLDNKVG